jgi:hypothetical protein
MVDPLSADSEIDTQPDPRSAFDLVHIFVLRLERGEPTDRDMPGGSEDMGAMTRVLLVVSAKLAVGGPGCLLGNKAGPKATKRVRERDGRLEDTKTEIAWAHHSLPIPLDHPVGITLGLGEQAVAPNEPRHRVAVLRALWGVDPEMGGLGHSSMVACLGPTVTRPGEGRPGKIRRRVRTAPRERRTELGRIR